MLPRLQRGALAERPEDSVGLDATMKMVGNVDVIRAAAAIPGIMGVELQVTAGTPNLRDWDAVRNYKRQANRWAMSIPSLAGVWDPGVQTSSPAAAENVRLSIRAAEMLQRHPAGVLRKKRAGHGSRRFVWTDRRDAA
jgi:hypothetical protein